MPDEKYMKCLPIVEKMYKEGAPVKEIVKKCGNSHSTVYKALYMLEKEGKIRLRKGHYRSSVRVSEEELEQMIELYRNGYSIYRIAKMLDRPFSTVYQALKRTGVLHRKTSQ